MGNVNIALSGMNAASQALEVFGNNIANSNTVGFKTSSTMFADVYTGTAGGLVAGSGVSASVRQNFGTSSITPSSNVLDLAINGGGFFIQSNKGAISYTRNGQFKLNDAGDIINANSGFNLVGKRLDGTQGTLTVPSTNLAPKATSILSVGVNLSSSTNEITNPPVTTAWTGGANPSSNTYTHKTSTTFYDSLGNSHVLDIFYIRANGADANNGGPANTWYFAAQVDGVDVSTTTAGANINKLQSIDFNADGTLKDTRVPGSSGTQGSAITPAGTLPITIPTSVLNGASGPTSISIDMNQSTQFGSPFAVQSIQDDGYPTGILSGLSIDTTGAIYGNYSNGKNSLIGTVQLAVFKDPEKLQNTGQNSWVETFGSGKPLVSNGNSGSAGQIQSGATEDSATDLTASLVGLNNASRTFQANARIISVSDEMIRTIIQSVS